MEAEIKVLININDPDEADDIAHDLEQIIGDCGYTNSVSVIDIHEI